MWLFCYVVSIGERSFTVNVNNALQHKFLQIKNRAEAECFCAMLDSARAAVERVELVSFVTSVEDDLLTAITLYQPLPAGLLAAGATDLGEVWRAILLLHPLATFLTGCSCLVGRELVGCALGVGGATTQTGDLSVLVDVHGSEAPF